MLALFVINGVGIEGIGSWIWFPFYMLSSLFVFSICSMWSSNANSTPADATGPFSGHSGLSRGVLLAYLTVRVGIGSPMILGQLSMKRTFFSISFCLGLQVPSPATAQVDGHVEISADILQEAGHKLAVSGKWKYHPGDDSSWAHPDLDDSDWENAFPLLKPGKMPASGWPGIGWFRLHVGADSTLWNRPLAVACKQYGASEVYLDGQLLQSYGRIGADGIEIATDIDQSPRLLTLNPASAHVIAIRHANTSREYLLRIGEKTGFKLWLGELDPALSRRVADVGMSRTLQQFSVGVLVAFASFHLLMFLFYPELKRNLYVSIFAGVIAVLAFCSFQIQFAADLGAHTLVERVWRLFVVLSAVSGSAVCYSLLYSRMPQSFWGFLIAGMALVAAAQYRLNLLTYLYLFVLIVFLDVLRLIVLALRRRRRVLMRIAGQNREWMWVISIGMAGSILTITYQILINLDYVSPLAGFRFPYLLGVLFFLVPISAAYLFYDFAQIHWKLRHTNLQLERRVEQRTRDLEEAMAEADAANRAKSRFLANVSHEIRTPMNAILGYAQLLQRSPDLALEHRSAVETIHGSGSHLLNLLDDVLELSKIESGRPELHEKDFDLDRLLARVESMFVVRCAQQDLTWSLDQPAQEPLWVRGDESKLTQVLINLLSNAVKYTSRGGVLLEVASAGKDRFRFAVRDTGPGISEKDRESLFMAFEQGAAGVDRGGAGLGLAIAQRYVELMGGELTVDSTEEGVGTCFAFTIPLLAGQEDERAGSYSDLADVRHLAPGYAVAALVVDDDPESRTILAHLLEEVGVDVETADGGQRALDHLSEGRPDVLFLDIQMPEMDGFETLAQIRAHPEWDHVRVIAISASVLDFERKAALEFGFDAFIGKPFRFEQVYACLSELLEVEFVRGASEVESRTANASGNVDLPPALVERLTEAVTFRQVTQMESCFREMEQLSPGAGQMAAHLRELRQQHRMEEILSLLKETQHA